MATFSHRLYKDEFSKGFIYQLEKGQIEGLKATDESTEKVLVIVGELEILENLGHIMYCEDEQKIKSVFPSYITKEDYERQQKEFFSQMHTDLMRNLCEMIHLENMTNHKNTEEYNLMYRIHFMMNDIARA